MMFEKIYLSELPKCIEIAFTGDGDLAKYHIKAGTLLEQVQDTYNAISSASDNFTFKYFKVVLNGVIIGFTVLSEQSGLLYSFGINKEYRTKEILQEWFENVVNILGSFNCYIWTKNERAILHLVKQGMKVKPVDYVHLTYTKCP